ncbi:putative cytochrome b561 [Sphingomonas changbaiensis NBRC 104936]|uniref:Putative cytochrome b561 n=1 Tax=Sphingomonas changbaiensis NBRC 104936 TaxID=1219043 RepID=A0A0E9MML2_9SPHN|nr:cytochrome b [Sphingomonas changbaiensis]GAO38779.1 putative cytochrome b561 [Sphingomonas changbaiensis NBRC 104936]
MATVPEATDQRSALLRYNNGAITLHWLTVVLVLAQLYLGFTFADMERGPARSELFTWHKTVGATILVLSLIRLAWRLMHKPPPFPESLPRWERIAAVWNHRAFYLLLIALPLTGLATISAGHSGVTKLAGGVSLPLIPGLPVSAGDGLGTTHMLLVFVTIALVVLHVGAALKHQFIDHARASGRMPPFQVPGNEPVEVPQR